MNDQASAGRVSAATGDRLVRNCSVSRTLDILSDAWSFLVLREMYMGARRFDQIQTVLKVPRSTLSDRLTRLMDAEIIDRRPNPLGKLDYRLTPRGIDLYLVMLALMKFGDDHLSGGSPLPLQLYHQKCGHFFSPETICSACREPVVARDVAFRNGPGAGRSPLSDAPQRRQSSKAGAFERHRPSSVSRTVAILANRWSFLILRECFFGVRRYDQFADHLAIAPNILADRLRALVDTGILRRHQYQSRPARFEYRLTEIGFDLYLPLIQMLRWGDQWLGHLPPLLLHHNPCGKDFEPLLVCNQCRDPVSARDVRFRLSYASPTASDSRAEIKTD